ncbi:MAG: hypothetical protein AAGH53_02765 [Pseudomonadota bacterium]
MINAAHEFDRLANVFEDNRAIAMHRTRATHLNFEDVVHLWGDSRARDFSAANLTPMGELMPPFNREMAEAANRLRQLVGEAELTEGAIRRVASERDAVSEAVRDGESELSNARFYCSEAREIAASVRTRSQQIAGAVAALGSPPAIS